MLNFKRSTYAPVIGLSVVLCLGIAFLTKIQLLVSDPRHTMVLPLPQYGPVKMYISNSVRYHPIKESGARDFSQLLPDGTHLVHDTDGHPHTVVMLHQLRCLSILRDDYASGIPSPHRHHCLNYLRQSVLCAADTRLEAIGTDQEMVGVGDYVCNDWTALYDTVKEHNRKVHVSREDADTRAGFLATRGG